MDGPQVSQELKLIFMKERIDSPYICCLSAYTEAAYQKQAIASGMNHYVSKPVSHNEIVKICSILDKPPRIN